MSGHKVRYEGEEANIGRFGVVRKGDFLVLTDHEYVMTQRDPVDAKRYVPHEGVWTPLVFVPRKATKPKSDAPKDELEEYNAILEWNSAEEKRISELNKANDPKNVQREDLRTKNKEELLKIVADLEGKGVKISMPQNPNKAIIVNALEAYYTNVAKQSGK